MLVLSALFLTLFSSNRTPYATDVFSFRTDNGDQSFSREGLFFYQVSICYSSVLVLLYLDSLSTICVMLNIVQAPVIMLQDIN